MDQSWINSSIGQRVLSYALDPRPVWFWNEDGSVLIWRNMSAKLFRSKFKKKGLKFLPDPMPLKGQVTRLIKLGNEGIASISRMRFQMGKKPVSATCSCVPFEHDGDRGLLVISTDSIDFSQFDGDAFSLVADEQLFDPAQNFAIINADSEVVSGALIDERESALEFLMEMPFQQLSAASTLEVGLRANASLLILDAELLDQPFKDQEATTEALEQDDELQLSTPNVETQDNEISELSDEENTAQDNETNTETKTRLDAVPSDLDAQSSIEGNGIDLAHDDESLFAGQPAIGNKAVEDSELVSLIDKLYQPEDTPENLDELTAEIESIDAEEVVNADAATEDLSEIQAALIQEADGMIEEAASVQPDLWTISASHLTKEVSAEAAANLVAEPSDKTSKYNFDELSRILRERVNADDGTTDPAVVTLENDNAADTGTVVSMTPSQVNGTKKPSALLSLSDEALVLNKLPLGILIFKDQEILFANRSMADLAGYETTGDLRVAGLDAILPRADEGSSDFGPVAKLIRKNGEEVDVSARLQTTTWQSRSCYMLTAREDTTGAKSNGVVLKPSDASQSDLGSIAAMLGQGFIQLNRAGYVLDIDEEGSRLFGPSAELLRNRPILEYVAVASRGEYLNVLSGNQNTANVGVFAGADHCNLNLITFGSNEENSTIFGFLSAKADEHQPETETDGELGKVLPILSREIRRPLATVSGFNGLMQQETYGPINNDRYKEYVDDIQKATKQIEQVISEIDDLGRLNVGEMDILTQDIDLGLLLGSCITRIRSQANAQRVFVRSAIPDAAYFVQADEKLLTQTVMNLLASAVTLTPAGGNVILSAVPDENGDLMIHVRDMGDSTQNRQEEFIVYHEADNQDDVEPDFVRSGVGLSLTQALAKANAFSLSLDQVGRSGMLMALTIPAKRVLASKS